MLKHVVNQPEKTPYPGFTNTGTTAVPNDLFDLLAPDLSEAELRVLLYIIRRTCGFHKEADAISISQLMHGITNQAGRVLDRGTGLSKPSVLTGIRNLVEKGIITQTKTGHNEANVYTLNYNQTTNLNQHEYSKNEYYCAEHGLEANPNTLTSSNQTPKTPEFHVNPFYMQGQNILHENPNTERNMITLGKKDKTASLKVVKQHDLQIDSKQKNQNKISNNNDVVGALALHNQNNLDFQMQLRQELTQFGLNATTIDYILANYPLDYISQKITLVTNWLKKSGKTPQNPAGFLRRAIEEDYRSSLTTNSNSNRPNDFAATIALLQPNRSDVLEVISPKPTASRYRKHSSFTTHKTTKGLSSKTTLPQSNDFTSIESNFTRSQALQGTSSQVALQAVPTASKTTSSIQTNLPQELWDVVRRDIYERFGLAHLQPLLQDSTLTITSNSSPDFLQITLQVASLWQRRSIRPSDLQVIRVALRQRLAKNCSLEVVGD
jgi:hypothetical protein